MDGIKMLKTRQTDRKFLPYSIDLSIIENIVDCARLAPSAKNRQLLRYVVVDDREILDKFAEICEFLLTIDVKPAIIIATPNGAKNVFLWSPF